jgi:ABC-2 type transport system permease protein
MTDPFVDGGTRVTPPIATDRAGGDWQGAVHHLGYRKWSGRLVSGWTRWTVISAAGARRAWQSRWLRRMLMFAWLPTMGFGLAFFAWEQAALYPEIRQGLIPLMRMMPATPAFDEIRDAVQSGDFESGRHTVWAWLLQSFFLYPQGVLMVLVVGLIAPPLISQDIRSRAFLLYFSRPLGRAEYLLGKLATLWLYLSMISAVPALSLYLLGVVLSPSLAVVLATWDLPLRIVAASIVLMLPTSVIALCFSSLTQESRYAGFAWFAVWVLGWFTYGAVRSVEAFNTQHEAFSGSHVPFARGRIAMSTESAWTHLSLYHTLGRAQRWVFGFADFNEVRASVAILLALTLVSLAILYRRISAPMRV